MAVGRGSERMLRTLAAHLRAQWMGALALFLVLAGGTAYAANTVFSTDIVNGEVKTPDLASNAVGTGKVANNSLTGSDIVESSLGEVPSARLGGLGGDTGSQICDPQHGRVHHLRTDGHHQPGRTHSGADNGAGQWRARADRQSGNWRSTSARTQASC